MMWGRRVSQLERMQLNKWAGSRILEVRRHVLHYEIGGCDHDVRPCI
jgi:hypothetical protein